MFGLRDRVSHMPHRKRTRLKSNSKHFLDDLSKNCNLTHQHQQLIGKVKVLGKWQARGKLSQQYPKGLCKAVLRGLLFEGLREDQQTDAQILSHPQVS